MSSRAGDRRAEAEHQRGLGAFEHCEPLLDYFFIRCVSVSRVEKIRRAFGPEFLNVVDGLLQRSADRRPCGARLSATVNGESRFTRGPRLAR
jgi:hypothetical protein